MINSIKEFFYNISIIFYAFCVLLIFLPFLGISIFVDYLLYKENYKKIKKKELDRWEQ